MATSALIGERTLLLRSQRLLARLAPHHGGEVLDLIDLVTGRQLLGRPPFRPEDPLPGELSEEQWTTRYRGGWQITVPNVCNACNLDGVEHGFHGSGSVDPWQVVTRDTVGAILQWTAHGLHVVRTFTIEDDRLRIETEARAVAARPVPMIVLEHCTVGLEILDPEVTLRLPAAPAYEVCDDGGPIGPSSDTPAWPHVALLDGSQERADTWPISQARSRWIVLHSVPEGRAEVVNAAHGTGLALEWDVATLPHLHVWHESGGGQQFWHGRARILGVEPTNVPHGLGLARAVQADQARWIHPDEPMRWWISAQVLG